MIRRFEETTGRYIEKIIGQERFAFAHSDSNDFYDLIERAKTGGYPGSIIMFFDFETGGVYKPFGVKPNVVYGDPVYADGFYYFLQGDYDEKKIVLYRFVPNELLEEVTRLNIEEVDLYNLRIIGNPVHVVSEDDIFSCYYPEKFSFPAAEGTSAMFIEDGKIYFSKWFEEDASDPAGDQYKYRNGIVVKDYGGNTLCEEIGDLCRAADGTWWIS